MQSWTISSFQLCVAVSQVCLFSWDWFSLNIDFPLFRATKYVAIYWKIPLRLDKPFADWFAFSFSKCSMGEYSMLVMSENDWLDRLGSFCDHDGRSVKILHTYHGYYNSRSKSPRWNYYMQYLIHDTTNIWECTDCWYLTGITWEKRLRIWEGRLEG